MRRSNRFWWFAVASIAFTFLVIFSLVVIFWQQLPSEDKTFLIDFSRQYMGYLFSVAMLLLAGLGFGLDWVFRLYILPINKLAEETRMIHAVNPSHRIHLEGGQDIIKLADVINEAAEHYERLHNQVEDKIQQATALAEEEKNILAAIMAELPEGVLICNTEGQILLYNKRASHFLVGSANPPEISETGYQPSGFIGLGRSVFSLIDKQLIVHALDEIADKLKRDESDIAAYFVLVGQGDRLLRAEAVPVLDHQRNFTGFILMFHDITRQHKADIQLEALLQSFTRGTRSSLASIRAATEAMIDYPDMQSDQLNRFKEIIHHESLNIGKIVEEATSTYPSQLRARWPLIRMPVREMLKAAIKKADDNFDLDIQTDYCQEDCWIRADSYSIVSAIIYIQKLLADEIESGNFHAKLTREGQFVQIDFIWQGKPIPMETLRKWEEQPIALNDFVLPSTLKEIIEYHKMKIWSHSFDDHRRAYLRLLIPAVEAAVISRSRDLTILPESRPEFFDFDLFNQPDQRPEVDQRPLSELSFTVFDTETTGLDPKGGDEIISIGAVRIVNNRLLQDENFDHLIDPRRSIPAKSTLIHGIRREMLDNKPTIEMVLPRFFQFAAGTILVAHNAAFDMRMLQLKETDTGVVFTNPVLDTMLLSAVVQPGHKDHDMEKIAARLGISIVGRHTALGDAIATGEIFLKLIPLLEKQGISTLEQARAASRKTYYARLKY